MRVPTPLSLDHCTEPPPLDSTPKGKLEPSFANESSCRNAEAHGCWSTWLLSLSVIIIDICIIMLTFGDVVTLIHLRICGIQTPLHVHFWNFCILLWRFSFCLVYIRHFFCVESADQCLLHVVGRGTLQCLVCFFCSLCYKLSKLWVN